MRALQAAACGQHAVDGLVRGCSAMPTMCCHGMAWHSTKPTLRHPPAIWLHTGLNPGSTQAATMPCLVGAEILSVSCLLPPGCVSTDLPAPLQQRWRRVQHQQQQQQQRGWRLLR